MSQEKQCTKCGEVKCFDMFNKSKTCRNGVASKCKDCMKLWRIENKQILADKRKITNAKNKVKIAARCKKYYEDNRESIKYTAKKYYENNKAHINKHARKYQVERMKTDPIFKLKSRLSIRTFYAFKNKGYRKESATSELLGVPYEIAKAHIERQFTKGMTWANHGKWHIDHIIPLASAVTETELIKLCHYTNLQPLWSKDNLSKSDSIQHGTQVPLRF